MLQVFLVYNYIIIIYGFFKSIKEQWWNKFDESLLDFYAG